MPAKVQYEQAKGFVKAFLSGPTQASDHRLHAVPRQDRASSGREAAAARAAGAIAAAPRRSSAASTAWSHDVRHGRFERSLSGLTAVGALVTGVEIWMEHDRASFGNTDDVGRRSP